jgi:hypothetical protein
VKGKEKLGLKTLASETVKDGENLSKVKWSKNEL